MMATGQTWEAYSQREKRTDQGRTWEGLSQTAGRRTRDGGGQYRTVHRPRQIQRHPPRRPSRPYSHCQTSELAKRTTLSCPSKTGRTMPHSSVPRWYIGRLEKRKERHQSSWRRKIATCSLHVQPIQNSSKSNSVTRSKSTLSSSPTSNSSRACSSTSKQVVASTIRELRMNGMI